MSPSPFAAPFPILALALAACEVDGGMPIVASSHLESAARVPHPEGVWRTLPWEAPHNPVHALLLHSQIPPAQRQRGAPVGDVFIVSGSGDDAMETDFTTDVLHLSDGTYETDLMPYDGFCGGISTGANGNPFITGGTIYDGIQPLGLPDVSSFVVSTGTLVTRPSMANGRWYDTVTLLGDGRFMADSGWDQVGINATVEIFTPGQGWSPEYPMGWVPMFYPRQHLLPDGTVIAVGPESETRLFDPAAVSVTNPAWSYLGGTNFGHAPDPWGREYGTSVLLGLQPDDGYAAKVMLIGGNLVAPTATTELLAVDDAPFAWQWGPSLAHARTQHNAVILPDQTVLVVGGVSQGAEIPGEEDPADAVLDAELYDPVSNTFSPAGAGQYPRMYHSVALLLPDASVWVAGTQYGMGTYDPSMEIYYPAYLFNAAGGPAVRPVLRSVPAQVGYGRPFTVLAGSSDVASVVLVHPGAVTHAFDTDQRLVELEFTLEATPGELTLIAPPNGNIAPPGYYMLFLIDPAGTPSVARFVSLQ